MATAAPGAVTELLRAWSDGDEDALERLAPRYMGRERRGHALQVTALVNEAFLRLTDASSGKTGRTCWGSRRA